MKNAITLLVTLLFTTAVYSQSVLLWSENYPANLANEYTYPLSLSLESNIIRFNGETNIIRLDGITLTQDRQRLLTVRYNLEGDTLSSMQCGGDSISNNKMYDYEINVSNDIYILQHEKIEFYKTKLVVQKYDEEGNFIWISKISNPGDTSFAPHSILVLNDSCVIVSGYKEFNYPKPGDDYIETISIPILIAFRTDGTFMWKREFNINTELNYFMYPLFSHADTAYIIGMGNSLQRNLIKVTSDNNYAIITDIELQNGVSNVLIKDDISMIVTNSFGLYRISELTLGGEQVWTQVYPSNLPNYVIADEINATMIDDAGNIYITGRHSGEGYNTPEYTNNDILTIKYDINGNKVWENRYWFGVLNADIGNRMCLKNGYLYVAGQGQRYGVGNHYDFIVLKIDGESGETAGVYYYDGEFGGNDALYGIEVLENDSLVIAGLSYNGVNYHWTTQLLSDVILSTGRPDHRLTYSLFPNPADRDGFITLAAEGFTDYNIISSTGIIVKTGKLLPQKKNQINLDQIKSGLYLVSLRGPNGESIRKLVIK